MPNIENGTVEIDGGVECWQGNEDRDNRVPPEEFLQKIIRPSTVCRNDNAISRENETLEADRGGLAGLRGNRVCKLPIEFESGMVQRIDWHWRVTNYDQNNQPIPNSPSPTCPEPQENTTGRI